MITKNQKVKGSVIKVLLTLPVFALLILLNTQCDNTKPNEEKQKAVEVKVDENAGQLLGTILDRFTEKPIALATILLEKDGKELYYTTSDKNGRYEITKIKAGAYNVKVSCEGYETVTIRDVNIPVKKITFQDFFTFQDFWLKNKEASAAPSQE